jgi:hypothetical protein
MTVRAGLAVTVVGAALAAVPAAVATSPPVGPLPAGTTSNVLTTKGELVAIALPHRSNGRTWRIVRISDARVLRQVSEADVGANVVLVFKAARSGTSNVVLALTRGERPKAYESRRFVVRVR